MFTAEDSARNRHTLLLASAQPVAPLPDTCAQPICQLVSKHIHTRLLGCRFNVCPQRRGIQPVRNVVGNA